MSRFGRLHSATQLIGNPHLQNFSFNPDGSCRRLSCYELQRVEVGDAKDCYAREPGNDFFEQHQLLATQLRDIQKHSRDIATWARKARYISLRNGIALQIYSNDRNAGRGFAHSGNRRRGCRENGVYITANQIGRSLRQRRWVEPVISNRAVRGMPASGTWETCRLHRARSAFGGNPEDNCSDGVFLTLTQLRHRHGCFCPAFCI